MWSTAQVSQVVTLVCIAMLWRRPILHSVLSTNIREAPTALQTETGDKQWLFGVILNLGTVSEVVTALLGTLTCHMLCLLHVFGLLVDYITRHSSRSVLIFRKSNRRSTSTVITVPLLIGIERKTWLMSCFLDRRDWQPLGLLSSLCSTPWWLLNQPTCNSRGSPTLITDCMDTKLVAIHCDNSHI